MQLHERVRRVFALEVDDRIEADDPGQRSTGQFERQHVAARERYVWIQLARKRDHLLRQVKPAHVDAAILQVARDLAGPAADLTNLPQPAHAPSELCKQLAVKGLSLQFS